MAVVINEFEMSPAPAAKADGGGDSSTGQEGPPTLAPDVLRQIEKALQGKHERIDRLTAY
jgi:hypothetical protein